MSSLEQSSAASDIAASLRADARRLRELASNLRATSLGQRANGDLVAAAVRLEAAAAKAWQQAARERTRTTR